MRRAALMLAAALCMTTTVPVFAQMTQSDKNECLLVSKNCADTVDDIQTRIKKLNTEISKGEAVYTPDELKKLQAKLDDIKTMLDNMVNHQ